MQNKNPESFAGSGCGCSLMPLQSASSLRVLQADRLWSKLSTEERRVVSIWESIASQMERAPDKGLEVARICTRYAGVVQGLSRGTIYRKIDAFKRQGIAGILGKAALRRIGASEGSALPQGFIRYWHRQVGLNQRGKILSVWHDLMIDLIAGNTIPGYDTDWRGIWLAEHPGMAVPSKCPYRPDHRLNAHPKGWSYRNLKDLAPSKDVLAAAHQGVAAGRAYLPSIPHTRVGLGPMEVITMDDVWHDVEVLFLEGSSTPTHERPVEVGVLDVLTGCHVAWQVWPVLRREDGSRQMVDWTVQRFIQAQIFCGIGVSPRGLTELLEHGTAGMDDKEVARINTILNRYRTPPEGKAWLTVLRSSTTGAPIAKGLFQERACGNPRHKAMLESSWNLLHNALASLPAATGRNRDVAPADAEGLRRENKALMKVINEVAKANPAALDILRKAEFHAVSFHKFKDVLRAVKDRINHRTDHSLEGWDKCGFTRTIATLPGGAELDLDALPPAKREEVGKLIKALDAPQTLRRMSPAEAFAKEAAATKLVRFPMAAVAEILGEELSQEVKVAKRGTLTVTDRFSREKLTYSAMAKTEEGTSLELTRGEAYRVWANPFAHDVLLVAQLDGRVLGVCPLIEATQHGDTEAVHKNLGLWSKAAAAQKERLEPVLAGRQARARETRQNLDDLISAAEASEEERRVRGMEGWEDLVDLGATRPEPGGSAGRFTPSCPDGRSIEHTLSLVDFIDDSKKF